MPFSASNQVGNMVDTEVHLGTHFIPYEPSLERDTDYMVEEFW